MKTCTSCQNSYPLTAFSFQKKHPGKLYAWCNGCRKGQVAACRPIKDEYDALRKKGREMRALTDAQITQARELRRGGMKYESIAQELGCSLSVAQRWARVF